MDREVTKEYTMLLSGVNDVRGVVVRGLLDSLNINNVVRYRHVPYEEVIIGGIDDEVDVYVKTEEFSVAKDIINKYGGE